MTTSLKTAFWKVQLWVQGFWTLLLHYYDCSFHCMWIPWHWKLRWWPNSVFAQLTLYLSSPNYRFSQQNFLTSLIIYVHLGKLHLLLSCKTFQVVLSVEQQQSHHWLILPCEVSLPYSRHCVEKLMRLVKISITRLFYKQRIFSTQSQHCRLFNELSLECYLSVAYHT